MPPKESLPDQRQSAAPQGPAPEVRPHTPPAGVLSVWTTLRLKAFRAFWIAGLFSMIGSWMQMIGSAWLMTDMSSSPFMIALVQAAQMIPTLFLAFIAGALADMIDRRKYMIGVMCWMIAVTLILAALTYAEMVTPFWLIFFTFLLGAGGACHMPAMSATIQDIVPRTEVVNAVTLNSLSMNISRLIGPAAAGLLIGFAGIAPAFLINAFSYFIFMWVVYRWEGPPMRPANRQSLWSNISAGVRYVRRAKRFQAIIIRGSCHFFLRQRDYGPSAPARPDGTGCRAGRFRHIDGRGRSRRYCHRRLHRTDCQRPLQPRCHRLLRQPGSRNEFVRCGCGARPVVLLWRTVLLRRLMDDLHAVVSGLVTDGFAVVGPGAWSFHIYDEFHRRYGRRRTAVGRPGQFHQHGNGV